MVLATWVLDAAVVVVSQGVAAGIVVVVGCDVAVAMAGSGCERWGWGLIWGAVGQLGSACHCFGGTGSWLEAGEGVVTVVVNIVGIIDGSVDMASGDCADIDGGDMAGNSGSGGSMTTVLGVA